MGAILEAQNMRLSHKRSAIKMLHPSLAMDPETVQRFRREAEIASSLGHDHIIEVHDFNVTREGEPYLVMEYLDGDDLAARLKARGPLSLADISIVLDQIASALEAAHAAGIVHRDLKPQNIFLCKRFGRDDFVKVLDFGVAKRVARAKLSPLHHRDDARNRSLGYFPTTIRIAPERRSLSRPATHITRKFSPCIDAHLGAMIRGLGRTVPLSLHPRSNRAHRGCRK